MIYYIYDRSTDIYMKNETISTMHHLKKLNFIYISLM
jgi:hypothetical protein